MRRRERAMLVLFVPLWAVALVFSIDATLRRTGFPLLYVSRPAAGEYPVVTGFKSAHAETSGLQVGDRLLRMGAMDLRGVGPVGLAVRFATWHGEQPPLAVVYERGGERGAAELVAGSYAIYWPRLLASMAFGGVALFLMLRARPSPMLRAIVGNFMSVAALLACTFAGGPAVTDASIVIHVLSFSLAAPLGLRAALLFPHGIEPRAWWGRIGPWLFAVLGPLDTSRFYEFPLSRGVGTAGGTLVGAAYLAALGIAIIRSYRRADPIGRRQLKWFLLGCYGAMLPPMLASILATYDAQFTGLLVSSMAALGCIPVFLLVAVVQYNYLDVDRLISATTSYTIFAIVVLAALMAVVPRLAHAVSEPLGTDPWAAQVMLSVIVASVAIGLERQLRPRIDQLFFAERYALARGVDRLFDALSSCPSPEALTRLCGERLDTLLRPESIAIYMRAAQSYGPAFVRGRAIPSAFGVTGPLIAALEERAAPLAADRFTAASQRTPLSPFERAALETLGVPAVVPIRRGRQLVGFMCLGPKRSGDVYTSTDLALLAALADKVSSELLRFDQDEVIRQGRAMQDALRRYVPGAIAEQLADGASLEVGERELSVLFVDMRGYSSYAEGRNPEEIFSTVNRYTETVSQIVRDQGGCIVEFNGDGMMAVFGAPRALAHKERAAVEAGRRIFAAVAALDTDGAPRSVGVGIATGAAFVGNVQAVDRYIWTAIGNTTNLAARLQALTRELDAAMVIDAATWLRAGDVARPFTKHDAVPIRGRAQREDLYVLPLAAA